jgi:hypothetical protein
MMLRKLINLVCRNKGVAWGLSGVTVDYDQLFFIHHLEQMALNVIGQLSGTVIFEALDKELTVVAVVKFKFVNKIFA